MSLVSFEVFFPELAAREATVICLSAGERSVELVLAEVYCADPGCDCDRFGVQFVDAVTGEILATISHGRRPVADRGSQATFLDPSGEQADVAPHLLELFQEQILTPDYEERLRRHAQMVRELVADAPELRSPHHGAPVDRLTERFASTPYENPPGAERREQRERQTAMVFEPRGDGSESD